MKNFFQWAEERKYDLESLREQPAETKDTKGESQSAKRAAIRSHAYPPAYGRAQYPDGYFRPIAADAPVYQAND